MECLGHKSKPQLLTTAVNGVRTFQAPNLQHPRGILWPREGDPKEWGGPWQKKRTRQVKVRGSYEGQTLLPGKLLGEVTPFFTLTSPGGWATPVLSATCPLLFQVSLWPKIFWVRREASCSSSILEASTEMLMIGCLYLASTCRERSFWRKQILCHALLPCCSINIMVQFKKYLLYTNIQYTIGQSIGGLRCAYSTDII